MNEFDFFIRSMLVLWIVMLGIVWMVRGPRVAVRVFLWPLFTILTLSRRAVGGLLIALGQAIRGRGGQQHGDQRRR